ncbi:MAG: hypothetical protein FWE86_03565 [Oscillospiraceae bacterium]|nr:hypothetical protein [Oscillospiraceae bacterium]
MGTFIGTVKGIAEEIARIITARISKFMHTTLGACIKVGGFFGWFLAVMYICEYSLHYYRDDSMLAAVSTTFLLSAFITAVLASLLLLFLDIEGILSNNLLRWLPGLLMAESGIALSLANAVTMTAFAAVAGCAFGVGAMAILTCLLRVRLSHRLTVIASGLALGAAFRLLLTYILERSGQSALLLAAIAVGIFAALTIHSVGYNPASKSADQTSGNAGLPPVALAELPPKKLLGKIPAGYFWIFLCMAAFYAAQGFSENLLTDKIIISAATYDYTAYAAFGLAALLCGLLLKFRHLPAILACAPGVAAAGAALSGLSNVSSTESALFALLNYAAMGVFIVGMYVAVVNLSVDKPHQIFYAMLGFAAISGGQLFGQLFAGRVGSSIAAVIIFVILMPICGAAIHFSIRREGLTQDKLDRFGILRGAVENRTAEAGLSGQEAAILRHTVLDGCNEDEIVAKMLVSRNTVRAGTRGMLRKLDLPDIETLREHFNRAADRHEELRREQDKEEREYKDFLHRMKEENKAKKEERKEDRSVIDIVFGDGEELLPQVRESADDMTVSGGAEDNL